MRHIGVAVLAVGVALGLGAATMAYTSSKPAPAPAPAPSPSPAPPTIRNVFTISSGCGVGGNIWPAGQVSVNASTAATFAIVPNQGYTIASVAVDGNWVGAMTGYTFTNVQANHSIYATFNVAYTITAVAGAGGAISPPGQVQVISGGTQLFTMTPSPGYSVTNVLVDNVSVGATPTYTFVNVITNHTISARFAIVKTLTIQSWPPTALAISSATGHGGTTNYKQANVEAGKNVNLSAPVNDPYGYTFAKWTTDGLDKTLKAKAVTFPMSLNDSTAVAVYEVDHCAIHLSAGKLAGQDVTPTDHEIIVNAGAKIAGSLTVSVHNSLQDWAIAPCAATATWGKPEKSFWEVNPWVPTGDSRQTVTMPAGLTAPSVPGTYYIAVAMKKALIADLLMSGTDWYPLEAQPTFPPVWANGNILASRPGSEFETAMTQGWIPYKWQTPPMGYSTSELALTAVRVIVQAPH